MDDIKAWWVVIVATAGVVAKVAVDWSKGADHERRITDLERWKQEHSNRFSKLLGKLGEDD